MQKKILILGTGTFAVEVADLISEIPSIGLVGFVENIERERCRERLEGLPIYWIDDIAEMTTTHHAICALSTTHRSKFIDQAVAYNIPFTKIVHPSARISSNSSIGKGTIINPGVIIASHTHLGQHVIVNRGALIGHHTIIGDYTSIQPGANIAGACSIGKAAYIGMGAVLIDKISIGEHSVVAAGAVVVKDVPCRVMVAGVPAKITKEDIDGK